MEGILRDNRVSKRRGVRLTVDWLDKTKKIKRPFIIIIIFIILIEVVLERRIQEYRLLREQKYKLLRELKKRGKTVESEVIELDEDDGGNPKR